MRFSGNRSRKATSRKYISAAVAALGALAITAQANAADIYAPAPGGYKDIPPVVVMAPTWTGFYAGVNMGAAWSQLSTYRNGFYNANGSLACTVAYCLGGDDLNATTAFGGGQLGYNWQGWGNVVVGLEVDLEGIGSGGDRTFVGVVQGPVPLSGYAIAARIKQDGGFAGDVTGRLGYAWGNWMLYAKGGFAWFNPNLSASAVAYNGTSVYTFNGWNNDTTLTGWTVGGGAEWMLNPNWSVKLEYLYYDFGLNNNYWATTYTNGGVTTPYSRWRLFDNDLTVSTVKLGINYHLTNNAGIPLN